ncbi:MAG: Ig-like domain-containing protein [Candidatus Thorarchaeota archaeon]|nr:Ig-like domain-containing protein [Candidatus Thorarchaeota archaeon]
MMKRRAILIVVVATLLLLQLHILDAQAWSNGGKSTNEDDPDYGTHDQFAKYGMIYVKENFPGLVSWIEEDMSEYLYYTEVPDMVLQDWTNHNYDFGDYGYRGGSPDRGAPDAVQTCYDWVVGNLTLWVDIGMPSSSDYTSNARKAMGMLTHYLADVLNPMHTDDDASDSGKEHEEYSGRVGNYNYRMSYHSCHEKATTRAWEAYEYEFDAIRPDIAVSLINNSAHDETLWCAQYSNMGADRTGRTSGYEGQNVGDHYQEFLEEIVYSFDNKICTVHHGITVEGTTDQLYLWNVEVMQLGATSIGKIIYQASTAAGVSSDDESSAVMYVQGISWDETNIHGRYPRTDLTCYVTIVDTNGDVVSGAEVSIDWTHPDGTVVSLVATTDSNGVAAFSQTDVESGTHTVTVIDVTKSNYTYDSSLNTETTDSYTV